MAKEFEIGSGLQEGQTPPEDSSANQGDQGAESNDQGNQDGLQGETPRSDTNPESEEQKFTPPPPDEVTTEVQEVKERSKKERSYTFVADPATDTILQNIMSEHDCGKGIAVNRLMSHLYNVADKEPEVEVKTEIVEKEVERPIGGNQVLISLDPEEARLIDMILSKRKEFAAKQKKEINEDRSVLLKGSFFVKGRLFNHDNEFYTGLSRSDVK